MTDRARARMKLVVEVVKAHEKAHGKLWQGMGKPTEQVTANALERYGRGMGKLMTWSFPVTA